MQAYLFLQSHFPLTSVVSPSFTQHMCVPEAWIVEFIVKLQWDSTGQGPCPQQHSWQLQDIETSSSKTKAPALSPTCLLLLHLFPRARSPLDRVVLQSGVARKTRQYRTHNSWYYFMIITQSQI